MKENSVQMFRKGKKDSFQTPLTHLRYSANALTLSRLTHSELPHRAMRRLTNAIARVCSGCVRVDLLRRRFRTLRELQRHFGQIDFANGFQSVSCRAHSDSRTRGVALAYDLRRR